MTNYEQLQAALNDVTYNLVAEQMRDWILKQFKLEPWELFNIDRELYQLVMTVIENPQEEMYRGVLADWLDDHQDARGPLVRATIGKEPYGVEDWIGGYCWSNYTSMSTTKPDKSKLPMELLSLFRSLVNKENWVPVMETSSDDVVCWSQEPWRLFARGFALWFGLPDPGPIKN